MGKLKRFAARLIGSILFKSSENQHWVSRLLFLLIFCSLYISPLNAQPFYKLQLQAGGDQVYFKGKSLPQAIEITIEGVNQNNCHECEVSFSPFPDGKAGPAKAQANWDAGLSKCVVFGAWKLSGDLGIQYLQVKLNESPAPKDRANTLRIESTVHEPARLVFSSFIIPGSLDKVASEELNRVTPMFGVEYPIIINATLVPRIIATTSFKNPGEEFFVGFLIVPSFLQFSKQAIAFAEGPIQLGFGRFISSNRRDRWGFSVSVDGGGLLSGIFGKLVP